MSQKRMPSDHEITRLAIRIRELWKAGEEVRPWLREQRELLPELVHGTWSWASMARVLTAAGITYRTGNTWSASLLRKDFSRAHWRRKRYARGQKVEPSANVLVVPAARYPSRAAARRVRQRARPIARPFCRPVADLRPLPSIFFK